MDAGAAAATHAPTEEPVQAEQEWQSETVGVACDDRSVLGLDGEWPAGHCFGARARQGVVTGHPVDDVQEEEAIGLGEVTVVAEVSTIQQKTDRKVITIGKDLTTTGATASEIMNRLPSVSVDSQSGNISLRGNENVRVLVDGKPTNVPAAQLLKQIPSTSIKSVELITNPSAKYNPEGMSGIINIILHKNTKLGFNGSIDFGLQKEINANFNSAIDRRVYSSRSVPYLLSSYDNNSNHDRNLFH